MTAARDKTKIYRSKQKELYNRQLTTENRGKSYNHVVCFPGPLALDIHAGFDNGILTEDTNIIAVERVKSRRGVIKRQLNKRTSNYQIAGTDAHRLRLNKFLADGEKIDYLPYDMCGNFTAKIAGWFFLNQKRFADGMRMSVTLTAINRKLETYNEIKAVIGDKYRKVVSQALKNAVFSGIGGFSLTSDMRDHIASQVFLLLCSMPDKQVEINRVSIYANTEISTQAKHMIVLDTYVYDSEHNVRKSNTLSRIVSRYNSKVCDAYQVILQPKVKAVRVRVPKAEKVELTIADKQSLLVNKIIDSGCDNKGVAWVTTGQKAAMTRYCNQLGKSPAKVWSAIRSWIRMRSGHKGIINTVTPNRS